MFLKKVTVTGAILATIMLLTGCSSTGGGEGDKVDLRYAIWDDTHMEAINTLIDEYESENPNINIELEQYTYNDYWTKMETSSAGGSAPDIFWMDARSISKYADNGMVINMEELIKENNMDMSNYLDNLTGIYKYNGDQYAIPTFWDDQIMIINTRLMKEYNISEPKENWTWEEMIAWLEEAKSKLPEDIYPITSYFTGSNQAGVFNEIASAGGKIISDDKKTALLNTPESKDGYTKYFELVQSDLHTPYEMTIETGNSTLFKSEKALMTQAGSYVLLPYSDKEQSKVAGNFKLHAIPTIKEGNKSKSIIHGLGNVISANSKHPDEAFKFIQFMSSEESMAKYTELALVPQAHKNVQDLFVKVMKEKTGVDASIISEVSVDAMPLPNSFETVKWDKVITDNINELMQGKISIDEAIEKSQKEMQEILDKENK